MGKAAKMSAKKKKLSNDEFLALFHHDTLESAEPHPELTKEDLEGRTVSYSKELRGTFHTTMGFRLPGNNRFRVYKNHAILLEHTEENNTSFFYFDGSKVYRV